MPEDVKGLKIRPAHATMAKFVTSLAATTCRSSAPEVRDIIEQRRRRRRHLPLGLAVLFGIDKGHEVPTWRRALPPRPSCIVINKDKYSAMSDKQKAAIATRTARPRWRAWSVEYWGKFEDAGVDKVKAKSHDVYKLTPDQTAAWKKAAERWSRPGVMVPRKPAPIRMRRWRI